MTAFEYQPIGIGPSFQSSRTPESVCIPAQIVPSFVHKIGALAANEGFANAVVDVFDAAHISFELDGDISPANDQGLVVAGDHSQGIEPLLVQALMAKTSRNASHVIAAPVSNSGRLMQATEQGKDLVIPVIPSYWAAENKLRPWHEPVDFTRRILHPSVLRQPKASLKRINAAAINQAAHHASNGEAVTIFPTGGLSDAADATWRNGLGHIVSQVALEAGNTTQVAVFKAEGFSAKKVLASLLLRDIGIGPKRQTIILKSQLVGSVEELRSSVIANQLPDTTQAITNVVRERYLNAFSRF